MPFMQDKTYLPRNFATLGPSELQPPFPLDSNQYFHISCSLLGTGQASDPIVLFTNLQSPVFLINSPSCHFHVSVIFSYPGLLSPKVTVLICRVPSILLSQSLLFFQLTHQWRFTVRYTIPFFLSLFMFISFIDRNQK